jgi:glutaredoxin-like protein
MRLLNDEIARQVKEVFAGLENQVAVLFFGEETGCDYCEDTRQLLEEVCELSDKLSLAVYDIEKDAEIARQYRVDKTPGTVIAAKDGDLITDYGIRYAGIPSGHEFTSLINDLVMVSNRNSDLNEATRSFLGGLTQPVLLQVFSTPT